MSDEVKVLPELLEWGEGTPRLQRKHGVLDAHRLCSLSEHHRHPDSMSQSKDPTTFLACMQKTLGSIRTWEMFSVDTGSKEEVEKHCP